MAEKPTPPSKVIRLYFVGTKAMPCFRSDRINLDDGSIVEMTSADDIVKKSLLNDYPENFTEVDEDQEVGPDGKVVTILPKREDTHFQVIENAVRLIKNNGTAREYALSLGLVLK